jgi:Protein of unknown function (DUF3530)
MACRHFVTRLRCALAVAAAATFGIAHAQFADDAREDRWAQQVAPQVVVGDVVWLATPQRAKVLALFTDAPSRKGGVIVVHGFGLHPDWGLNGALRVELADRGFATLSVQMPVMSAEKTREQYRPLIGVAGERIAAALGELRSRGITKVAIVSHSIGAGIVDAYLGRPDAQPVAAWIPIGMLADFARAPRLPVLDIVAERDFPEVLANVKLRALGLPRDRCSRVVTVLGTDHYFDRGTEALTAEIVPFLDRVFAGECT